MFFKYSTGIAAIVFRHRNTKLSYVQEITCSLTFKSIQEVNVLINVSSSPKNMSYSNGSKINVENNKLGLTGGDRVK